jgi:hypothetical protein
MADDDKPFKLTVEVSFLEKKSLYKSISFVVVFIFYVLRFDLLRFDLSLYLFVLKYRVLILSKVSNTKTSCYQTVHGPCEKTRSIRR